MRALRVLSYACCAAEKSVFPVSRFTEEIELLLASVLFSFVFFLRIKR